MLRWSLLALLVACASEPPECPEESKILVYLDEDLDGRGIGNALSVCALEEGYALTNDDCDDTEPNTYPDALELCDGDDNDCDGDIDDGLREITFYADADQDGYGTNDRAGRVKACAPPDGFAENNADCDDDDPLSYTGADEFCDGKDNDCDGAIDDADLDLNDDSAPLWYLDTDRDGYGDPDRSIQRCEGLPGLVANDLDCNDSDPSISPDAQEVCDGLDNDCDGYTDDSDDSLDITGQRTWYADLDLDGFGDANNTTVTCLVPWFHTDNDLDCDDLEPLIGPPETGRWTRDGDGDGYGTGPATNSGCAPPGPDYALEAAGRDCNDANVAVNPGMQEICNSIDDDCDLLVDDLDDSLDGGTRRFYYTDVDRDGFGDPEAEELACSRPPGAVSDNTDCDDTRVEVNPDGSEVCNGLDDDCDELVDDADPDVDLSTQLTWFPDFDGDGFGADSGDIQACSQPINYIDNADDCDDTDPGLGAPTAWAEDEDEDGFPAGPATPDETCLSPIPGLIPAGLPQDCRPTDPDSYPGAREICGDGIDQDCSGSDLTCAPPATCAELKALNPVAPSGYYSLSPDGVGVDVYCDMATDGGGWTLVSSSTSPPDDAGVAYSANLRTLSPSTVMTGVWNGLRSRLAAGSDIRFACKDTPGSVFMRVDLSFYDVHWYNEITTGLDFQSCFNEGDGVGYDRPAPARRNNLTGETRARGDDWNAGYLEGESACGTSDFSIDFDDRGIGGNPSDGTDWGEDGVRKCGTSGAGGAWFLFVRE
jgi:hypothetical protein